jgi:hypothetical protein
MRAVSAGIVASRRLPADASRRKPEPPEDPTGLVSSEVSSVDARRARDYLLRWKPATGDDDVVLAHGLRKETVREELDLGRVELARLP